MAFINENTKEINCKIVFYGPAQCGKTTTLKQILKEVKSGSKGELVSINADESDRTLYFDFVPLTLGKIRDYKVRLHVYTVPGQIGYSTARKILSKGIDGVVFMADSQLERMEDNIESLSELKTIIKEEDLNWNIIPKVLQYNKRDLPSVMPVEEMQGVLNSNKDPHFETIAITGEGVFDALKAIGSKVLLSLRK
ncbi:GTPase domain-containing protein [bacterium]|nr:GTPase domain-containing protein [bacterium]